MITWLREWVNQIVIASIIVVIIEMIVPNNNGKKYIKIILGIYMIFTILNPVLSKIYGNKISISNFKYNDYFECKDINIDALNKDNSKIIEDTYKEEIKNDISNKLKDKSFKLEKIYVEINLNENSNNYGKIVNIELWVKKNNKNEQTNFVEINEIDIKSRTENKISNNEKEELKRYIKDLYSIEEENIKIN